MVIICKRCKKIFNREPTRKAIFCSRKCFGLSITKPKTKKTCLKCKKEFNWKGNLDRIKEGRGKFCSKSCSSKFYDYKVKPFSFHKGNTPWNEGLKKETDERVARYSQNRIGIKIPSQSGEKNHNWAGDNIKYTGLHKWVYRMLGRPDTCEHCGKSGLKGREIHWANKSGGYKRELSDWLRLCVHCHLKYDGTSIRELLKRSL